MNTVLPALSTCLLVNSISTCGSAFINTTQQTNATENGKQTNLIMSTSQLYIVEFAMYVVLKPIVCISGFVGNVIVCFVLLQKSLRQTLSTYLLALLVADCGYLLCGILQIPQNIIKLTDEVKATRIEATLDPFLKFYLDHVFAKTAGWVICLLAIERLLAISFPLKIKTFALSRHSGKICVMVFVVMLILNIPDRLQIHFVYRYVPRVNSWMYVVERQIHSDAAESFFANYRMVVDDVIMLYIPPATILVCNLAIIGKLILIKKRRQQMFGLGTGEQRKVTLTLIMISVYFLGVSTLIAVRINLRKAYPELYSPFGSEVNVFLAFQAVTSVAFSINCANDFIIYHISNIQIRKALRKMICRGLCGQPQELTRSGSDGIVTVTTVT